MRTYTTTFILIVLALAPRLALAEDAIKDSTYNMPPAVVATMGVDEAMTKMETAAKPDVLEAFKKIHPAPFWLFGEDRQLAVRNNIIPAHWFENGAKQWGKFSGVARPGEFYAFQVCMLGGKGSVAACPTANKINLPGATMDSISGVLPVLAEGNVQPVWIGVQVPEDAKAGNYDGTIGFAVEPSDAIVQTLSFNIKVEGAAVPESGTTEAWRLARLKWLNSEIGQSDTNVTRPFTPIVVDKAARTLDILGRRITLGANGIPAQCTSYFSGSNTQILQTGRDAFSAPPRLECLLGGKVVEWLPTYFAFTSQTPVGVEWQAKNEAGKLRLTILARMEYDGNLQLRMLLYTAGPEGGKVDDVRFTVPWTNGTAKYAMGLGLQGGKCPTEHHWKWDISKNQDALWLGDANIGAMLRFKGANYRRPLINAYYDFQPLNLPDSWGGGGIDLTSDGGAVTVTANSGPKTLPGHGAGVRAVAFNIDWYFTPFKPLDVKQHFADHYYHAGQGAPLEDTAKLRQEGANILEIHHNRLCNPYINYPYNDDSFANLQKFVAHAHADAMRACVYYTTRELTQNLPEFFALKSMDGEIILPRRAGVAWPVTNHNGPHPWLQQHVGMDIVPAWRENLHYPGYKSLDLAVITTPDSRWNNFYLEGLNYLVTKAHIDGLYIDDTALDRKSMQRARRILDADGSTGRRVSMHSWNHFNGLAKWTNSSIAFMELYPYYNGLWHGEGFNANAAPEYMLVEMSGIPFGLMSEMLQGPNLWHGMVFGMRVRWPWSGDPRPLWKLEDALGIGDADFIGWWDKDCPVQTGNPQVKASVYRKAGKTLIALASWAPAKSKVQLTIDWKALGLDAKKTTLWAPPVAGFQPEGVFAADGQIPLTPGKGWLLIADETPRQISASAAGPADPFQGLTIKTQQAEPFEIKVPANTVHTRDLPWPAGASVAVARLDPMHDAGQSWGVGLAAGWADGKYVQIHARTDNRWGINHNNQEGFGPDHAQGTPATVAIKLAPQAVQIFVQEDGTNEWELAQEFPRSDFAGAPTTIRLGKIGPSWQPRNHGDKGGINPCRVEWVKVY